MNRLNTIHIQQADTKPKALSSPAFVILSNIFSISAASPQFSHLHYTNHKAAAI